MTVDSHHTCVVFEAPAKPAKPKKNKPKTKMRGRNGEALEDSDEEKDPPTQGELLEAMPREEATRELSQLPMSDKAKVAKQTVHCTHLILFGIPVYRYTTCSAYVLISLTCVDLFRLF